MLGVSTQRECQPSHLKADCRESGDGKRFGLDRDLPQLDKLSCRTLRFFGGFLYLYNMKLLSVLRSLIVEDRITLGSFKNGSDVFNVVATDHTQIANNPISLKSRPNFEDLGNIVFEFDDIISNVAKDIIVNRNKDSIFVRDNWNGFDFIIYPHYDDGEYKLNIATAIKHPQKLNIKNQESGRQRAEHQLKDLFLSPSPFALSPLVLPSLSHLLNLTNLKATQEERYLRFVFVFSI